MVRRVRSNTRSDGRGNAPRRQGNPAVAKQRFESARTREAIEDLHSPDALAVRSDLLTGCGPGCPGCAEIARESSWPLYQVFQRIDHWIHQRPDILVRPRRDTGARSSAAAQPSGALPTRKHSEQQLVAHLKSLLSSAPDGEALWRTIEPALARAAQTPGAFAFYSRDRELARWVCLFAPFWTRTPGSWDRANGTSLLEHVFADYPIPAWLLECSREAADQWDLKPLAWTVVLGRGASLRRVARSVGWIVPAGFPLELSRGDENLSFQTNCFLAELRRRGCPDAVAFDLSLSTLLERDPTERWPTARVDQFAQTIDEQTWDATIEWFSRFGEDLGNARRRKRVIRWLEHELTEAALGRRRPFSWKGRRPAPTYELARKFRKELHTKHDFEWPAKGWDHEFREGECQWTFRELTSTRILRMEGRKMGHCVAVYRDKCATGGWAIFSLTCGSEPRLTIEILCATGEVVQARGRFNREPSEPELRAIETWRKEIVLPGSITSPRTRA